MTLCIKVWIMKNYILPTCTKYMTWMSWAMMMIPHFLFDLRTAWIFTSKWGQLWKHQWMAKLCLHCGFLFHSSRRPLFIRWLVKKCADGRLLIYLHGRETPQTIANQQNSTAELPQYKSSYQSYQQMKHKLSTTKTQMKHYTPLWTRAPTNHRQSTKLHCCAVSI